MEFSHFINDTLPEPKILEYVVWEIQKNYLQYQNKYFFLKLESMGGRISKLAWVKTFDNKHDFAKFYYDTKFMRAAIMIKYYKGRYEILCQGFYYTDHFEIWPDKVLNSKPLELKPVNLDKIPIKL